MCTHPLEALVCSRCKREPCHVAHRCKLITEVHTKRKSVFVYVFGAVEHYEAHSAQGDR